VHSFSPECIATIQPFLLRSSSVDPESFNSINNMDHVNFWRSDLMFNVKLRHRDQQISLMFHLLSSRPLAMLSGWVQSTSLIRGPRARNPRSDCGIVRKTTNFENKYLFRTNFEPFPYFENWFVFIIYIYILYVFSIDSYCQVLRSKEIAVISIINCSCLQTPFATSTLAAYTCFNNQNVKGGPES
jgi:hypothetical protein